MNYEAWYEDISRPFRLKRAAKAVCMLDRFLVFAFAAAYVILLCVLFFMGDAHLVKALLVPAVTFALATGIRSAVNAPRPYETHAIDPVIPRDTRGKSLPSRHMASAVAIACALFWVNALLGVFAFIACALVAFTRIVGGVHFPRDIAAATLLSLACAAIGFSLIP